MDDTTTPPEPAPRKRSAMQFLHSATGDREAEASALNARSPAASTQADARLAVARAHGETTNEPAVGDHVASIGDAQHAQRQREDAAEQD